MSQLTPRPQPHPHPTSERGLSPEVADALDRPGKLTTRTASRLATVALGVQRRNDGSRSGAGRRGRLHTTGWGEDVHAREVEKDLRASIDDALVQQAPATD